MPATRYSAVHHKTLRPFPGGRFSRSSMPHLNRGNANSQHTIPAADVNVDRKLRTAQIAHFTPKCIFVVSTRRHSTMQSMRSDPPSAKVPQSQLSHCEGENSSALSNKATGKKKNGLRPAKPGIIVNRTRNVSTTHSQPRTMRLVTCHPNVSPATRSRRRRKASRLSFPWIKRSSTVSRPSTASSKSRPGMPHSSQKGTSTPKRRMKPSINSGGRSVNHRVPRRLKCIDGLWSSLPFFGGSS